MLASKNSLVLYKNTVQYAYKHNKEMIILLQYFCIIMYTSFLKINFSL